MWSEVSTVGGDQSVEELRRKLAETREQQAVDQRDPISGSPTGLRRVFAEMAAVAASTTAVAD